MGDVGVGAAEGGGRQVMKRQVVDTTVNVERVKELGGRFG